MAYWLATSPTLVLQTDFMEYLLIIVYSDWKANSQLKFSLQAAKDCKYVKWSYWISSFKCILIFFF